MNNADNTDRVLNDLHDLNNAIKDFRRENEILLHTLIGLTLIAMIAVMMTIVIMTGMTLEYDF